MSGGARKLGLAVLLILALIDLGRGGFHWLAPDSGAGSVAGMNLSYPNARDVVFLLSLTGISQILWGFAYLFVVFRARELAPLALASEVARGLMVLGTEYFLKPPVAPVPGRFMHIATTAVCAFALMLWLLRGGRFVPLRDPER